MFGGIKQFFLDVLNNKLPNFATLDGWGRLTFGATTLSLVLVLTIWTYVLNNFENQEHLILNNAKTVQQNLSIIISENLTQLLDRGKLFSFFSSQLIENRQDSLAKTRMSAMLGTDQAFNRMVIFDLNGHVIFASPPSYHDKKIMPSVQQVLDSDVLSSKHGVIFGKISKSLIDAWHIPLLYSVINSKGEKSGVLLLVLDLGYILRQNQNLNMEDTEVINIITDEDQEIMRESSTGLEFGGNTLIYPNIDAAKLGTNNFIESIPLFKDQLPRLITYQHSDHFPFATIVSRETQSVLKGFKDKKRDVTALVIALTIIVIAFMIIIVHSIKRKQRDFIALVESESEKNELILKLHDERQLAVDLSSIDQLTNLCNRRMFIELASNHLIQAKRNRLHYAVFFIDLDRFKAINDSLGHHVGDLLLQTTASRLQSSLRESDVIARFGGDEFVLILTGLESEDAITGIAEKVVKAVSHPCIDLAGHNLQIYPSIGISIFPRDGENIETLLRNADLAMYQSKQSKSRSYTFFDASLNVNDVLEFDLEQRFAQAIKDEEFLLQFQPKVDLTNYKIVGLEALVRWQHPVHGLIFPGSFISLAENSGHIIALGNWVIEATCRQLSKWKAEDVPIVPVAVNVSAHQLRNQSLLTHLTECLIKYDLDAEYIQVELTESSLVENIESAEKILVQLDSAGVHIALDDFGTGFSSLAYIKNLPIHTIKIDRSFISNIRNSHDDSVIVASTITLAHNLGMRVVAEGVETIDQLVYLRASNCDEVQGYLFCRPVENDLIKQLLIQGDLHP